MENENVQNAEELAKANEEQQKKFDEFFALLKNFDAEQRKQILDILHDTHQEAKKED